MDRLSTSSMPFTLKNLAFSILTITSTITSIIFTTKFNPRKASIFVKRQRHLQTILTVVKLIVRATGNTFRKTAIISTKILNSQRRMSALAATSTTIASTSRGCLKFSQTSVGGCSQGYSSTFQQSVGSPWRPQDSIYFLS